MRDQRPPHILNASANLLGICFVLLTGLKITNRNETTIADEITLFSSLCFLGAVVLSYLALRTERGSERNERWADYLFMVGLFSFFSAVVTFSRGYI